MKLWGKYGFEWAAQLRPQLDEDGNVEAFVPHVHYQNNTGLALHAYGQGPFCKFQISEQQEYGGVYLLNVGGKAMYIGECAHLANRYNDGYGSISPRNCYQGGQPTHCRINHLIYTTIKAGHPIELWFLKTPNRQAIATELIKSLRSPWNRKSAM